MVLKKNKSEKVFSAGKNKGGNRQNFTTSIQDKCMPRVGGA
jgi:hypothetical protein